MSSGKPDRRGEAVEEVLVAGGEFDALLDWERPVRHFRCVECLWFGVGCGVDGVGVVGRRVDVVKEGGHVVAGLAVEP